jgi:hypothetical protein
MKGDKLAWPERQTVRRELLKQADVDSRWADRSPASLAGLTVYPLASQHGVFTRCCASRPASSAPPDRRLLRPRRSEPDWRLSQRSLLRPQTSRRETVECEPHRPLKALDLRSSAFGICYGATRRTNRHFTLKENPLKRVRSPSRTCPASLDTLTSSVSPAVELAPCQR